MHDDLIEVAARRGRAWALAGVPIATAGPGVFVGIVAGIPAGVVTFAVLTVALSAWLLAGAPGIPTRPLPKRGLRPADPVVVHLAEGIGIANGTLPAAAWQLDHRQPNVAAIEQGERDLLLVTTGAMQTLTRDELEAVCATQLAIAHDKTCQRLEGMLVFWRMARVASVVIGFPAFFLFTAAPASVGGLFAALTFPAEAAGWLVAGKVKWWARVAADGVCVATTRHPAALVAALRKLAIDNGEKVPVGILTKATGAGATRWAIPPTMPWTMTTSVNDRVTDQRTAEQVEDVNLLVRAGLVRRICLEGGEQSLACRSEVVGAVRRAGRAAAMGGAAEVEGVLVGLQGAVGLAQSATGGPGWYPDPGAPGMLRWWDGRAWTAHQAPLHR